MRPENWNGETTIFDPEYYNVKVPVMDGGTMLCPCERCWHRFTQDERDGFIQHVAHNHTKFEKPTRTCSQCGAEFTLKRRGSTVEHCSMSCAAQQRDCVVDETMDEIKQDIFETIDVSNTWNGSSDVLNKEQRLTIHKAMDRATDGAMPRLPIKPTRAQITDNILTALGETQTGTRLKKEILKQIRTVLQTGRLSVETHGVSSTNQATVVADD